MAVCITDTITGTVSTNRKNGAGTFVIVILVSSQNIQLGYLRALLRLSSYPGYDWNPAPGLCQTLAQMFRLQPEIAHPSTAERFDYFLCFQGYFHLTGTFSAL